MTEFAVVLDQLRARGYTPVESTMDIISCGNPHHIVSYVIQPGIEVYDRRQYSADGPCTGVRKAPWGMYSDGQYAHYKVSTCDDVLEWLYDV